MHTSETYDEVVRWLTRSEAYPHRPACVEHLETHISHVLLAGPLVYKLKKPVTYDFLDFSTLAARERACREELRLNRRLAPDTYLDVVPVVREPGGTFRLGGHGEVVDWLVEMRRLPTELTLDVLARQGKLKPGHIQRLAAILNRFYESLPPIELPPVAYVNRCRQHVQGNLRELISVQHHLPHLVVERVHGFQLQLLGLAPELFEERAAAGRVIDGHGDLRPEHICLGEEVAIFDCIEFNAEFRQIDVADELAFLASECDFLGVEWVGPSLRAAYERHSGDRSPEVLWAFYKSYRACVRAKIAALRADQLQGEAQTAAVREAERHLAFADSYARPWLKPLVLVVGGLSGTGKTTLATALAEALGAELLRTDVIRREQSGNRPQPAQTDAGIYSPESRERVYTEMLRRARSLHGEGISVVLDGTFSEQSQLHAVHTSFAGSGHRLLAIECICPPETARERIARRLAGGRDASDATPALHDVQSQRWQHWPAEIPQVRIDTEQPLERQVEAVVAALRNKP